MEQEWVEQLSGYLDGELTDSECEALERLLSENPDAQTMLEQLRRVREQLGAVPRLKAPAAMAPMILEQLAEAGVTTPSGPADATGNASQAGHRHRHPGDTDGEDALRSAAAEIGLFGNDQADPHAAGSDDLNAGMEETLRRIHQKQYSFRTVASAAAVILFVGVFGTLALRLLESPSPLQRPSSSRSDTAPAETRQQSVAQRPPSSTMTGEKRSPLTEADTVTDAATETGPATVAASERAATMAKGAATEADSALVAGSEAEAAMVAETDSDATMVATPETAIAVDVPVRLLALEASTDNIEAIDERLQSLMAPSSERLTRFHLPGGKLQYAMSCTVDELASVLETIRQGTTASLVMRIGSADTSADRGFVMTDPSDKQVIAIASVLSDNTEPPSPAAMQGVFAVADETPPSSASSRARRNRPRLGNTAGPDRNEMAENARNDTNRQDGGIGDSGEDGSGNENLNTAGRETNSREVSDDESVPDWILETLAMSESAFTNLHLLGPEAEPPVDADDTPPALIAADSASPAQPRTVPDTAAADSADSVDAGRTQPPMPARYQAALSASQALPAVSPEGRVSVLLSVSPITADSTKPSGP